MRNQILVHYFDFGPNWFNNSATSKATCLKYAFIITKFVFHLSTCKSCKMQDFQSLSEQSNVGQTDRPDGHQWLRSSGLILAPLLKLRTSALHKINGQVHFSFDSRLWHEECRVGVAVWKRHVLIRGDRFPSFRSKWGPSVCSCAAGKLQRQQKPKFPSSQMLNSILVMYYMWTESL